MNISSSLSLSLCGQEGGAQHLGSCAVRVGGPLDGNRRESWNHEFRFFFAGVVVKTCWKRSCSLATRVMYDYNRRTYGSHMDPYHPKNKCGLKPTTIPEGTIAQRRGTRPTEASFVAAGCEPTTWDTLQSQWSHWASNQLIGWVGWGFSLLRLP